MQALNPTTTAITLTRTSEALSATFDRGTFTIGSLGLKLKGVHGWDEDQAEIDIEAVAPTPRPRAGSRSAEVPTSSATSAS